MEAAAVPLSGRRNGESSSQSSSPVPSPLNAATTPSNKRSSPTATVVPAWVTQGRTEHHASLFVGRTRMLMKQPQPGNIKKTNDAATETEEHFLIRWTSTDTTEWVPKTSVRLFVEGETRRRRSVKPIYTVEVATPKKKTMSNESNTTILSNRSQRTASKKSSAITTTTIPTSSDPIPPLPTAGKRRRPRNIQTLPTETVKNIKKETGQLQITVDDSAAIQSPTFSMAESVFSEKRTDNDDEDYVDEKNSPIRQMPPPPPPLRIQKEESEGTLATEGDEKAAATVHAPPEQTTPAASAENEPEKKNVDSASVKESPAFKEKPVLEDHENDNNVEPCLRSEGSVSDDESGKKDESAPMDSPAEPIMTLAKEEINDTKETIPAIPPSAPSTSMDPRLNVENYDLSDKDTFPLQLSRLLAAASELCIDHILAWEADGKTFRIHSEEGFLKLLTRLSANKKVIPFRNTLGQFNFQCVEFGEKGRAYQHVSAFPSSTTKVLFHKDASFEEIQKIRRRRPQTHKKKAPKGSELSNQIEKNIGSDLHDPNLEETGYTRSLRASTKAATAESIEKSEATESPVVKTFTNPFASVSLQKRFRLASLVDLEKDESRKRKHAATTQTAVSAAKRNKVNNRQPHLTNRMSRERERDTRRLSNGCLLPKVGSSYQLENGTWSKPMGIPPRGLVWDFEQGLWMPKSGVPKIDRIPRKGKFHISDSSAGDDDSSFHTMNDNDREGVIEGKKGDKSRDRPGRRSSRRQMRSEEGTPHRLVIQTVGLGGGGGQYIDNSIMDDKTIVRVNPSGKHHTLRSSPFFPTFLMLKKRHVFRGKFTAKTKANPTGTIGGDNQCMTKVKKDNFFKIQRLLHRERSEEDALSSSSSSGDSTLPAMPPNEPGPS